VLNLNNLRERSVGEKVTVWDAKILMEFEELLGGRPWEAGTLLRQGYGGEAQDQCLNLQTHYSISVPFVK
jgi:hypothetical protein